MSISINLKNDFSNLISDVVVFVSCSKSNNNVFSKNNEVVNPFFDMASSSHLSLEKEKSISFYTRIQNFKKVCYLLFPENRNSKEEIRRQLSIFLKNSSNSKKIEIDLTDLENLSNSFSLKEEDILEAITQGIYLSNYSFTKYQSEKKIDNKEFSFILNGNYKEVINKAKVISEGTLLARDLGHEPANELNPNSFSLQIKNLAKKNNLKCSILKESDLIKNQLNALYSVGKGSKVPPQLVILEYKYSKTKKKTDQPILIVGKGITFDSGGISIKPSFGMENMKFDMCGAAVALSTIITAAKLKLKCDIVVALPLAENLPGGNAVKPGDIVKTYSGKTVAIDNTDAEGRLILADALSYTIKKYKPKKTIDLATLTGSCIIALGHDYAGIMGNDKELIDSLIQSGKNVEEKLWQLPCDDDSFLETLKCPHADLKNMGNPTTGAGTIVAGKFLEQFVNKTNWVHLDIAGPSLRSTERYYQPKGASGFGVRLLVDYLSNFSNTTK